jgi:low temperature requirement protein LtrA
MQALVPSLHPRPQPRRVHDGEAEVRHATWLELFFDLVFVVAVARLALLLHDDHDLGGFLTFAGLFACIWWAWISYAYFADLFDEDRALDRLAQLAAMLGAAVVAVSLSGGVTDDSTLFAGSFAAMFALLAVLYAHAGRTAPEARELCRWYVAGSTVGASAWLLSMAVPSPGRYWLWGVAVVANALLSGPIAYARVTSPPRQVSHMPERFGLFAIVVLGEGVLAVVNGIESADWDTAAVVTALAGFVLAASVWWIYFASFDEGAIDRAIAGGRHAQVRSFLYGYGHLVVFIAVAASGVAVQLSIEASLHGDEPVVLLPLSLALVVGGFLVVAVGTGQLGALVPLVTKLGIVAATVLSTLLLSDPAVVTVVVAIGWLALAVHKTLYLRGLADAADAAAGETGSEPDGASLSSATA